MNETDDPNPTVDDDPNSWYPIQRCECPADETATGDSERTKQVTVAGYTAGFSAFFAVGAVATAPTWPVAIGVSSVSAMVAVVCYFILKR